MEETAHLPWAYRSLLGALHERSGLSCDESIFFCAMVMTVLCSVAYRRVKGVFARHMFGLLSGMWLMYSVYDPHECGVLLVYLLTFYPLTKRSSPTTVYVTSMCFLMTCFTHQAYFHYMSWRIDFTMTLMIMVMRSQTLAHDLADGRTVLRKAQDSQWAKNSVSLLRFRKENACIQPIGFFEYLCFQCFFLHALAGSSLKINEYMDVTKGTLYAKHGWHEEDHVEDNEAVDGTQNDSSAKSNFVKTQNRKLAEPRVDGTTIGWELLELAFSCTFMAIGMGLMPCSYILTAEWVSLSLWKRLFFWVFAMLFLPMKYCAVWKVLDISAMLSGAAFLKHTCSPDYAEYRRKRQLAEASAKRSGLGAEAVDAELEQLEGSGQMKCRGFNQWTRCRNANALLWRFPTCVKDMTYNWNMTANTWLTRYVFQRVEPPKWLLSATGSSTLARTVITRMTAALWHGVYPGFYIFFMCSILCTVLLEGTWYHILPVADDYEYGSARHWLWRVFWVLSTVWLTHGFCCFFLVPDLTRVVAAMNETYWFYLWLDIALLLIGRTLLSMGFRKPKKNPFADPTSAKKKA